MKDLFESLKLPPITWFGQRGMDCVGLHEVVHVNEIVCCDYGVDLQLLSGQVDCKVISKEKISNIRENWSNFSLTNVLTNLLVEKYLNQTEEKYVLAYSSTRALEKISNNNPKIKILAPHTELKEYFDNKLNLRSYLSQKGIDTIPGIVVDRHQIDEIKKNFSLPFVIQLPIGSSGDNTYFIENLVDLSKLQNKILTGQFLVSEYISGLSPNINALILNDQIIVSHPSVQIIGAKECTNNKAGYCGNDFSATDFLPKHVMYSIINQTIVIGNWMQEYGFRGIFGVDFITDGSRLFPLEINPRLQNSTQLLTQLHILEGTAPLPVLQISYFLDMLPKGIYTANNVDLYGHQIGAQIILHNRERRTVRVNETLMAGIYRLEGETFVFCRQGLWLKDCIAKGEFVVGGFPQTGIPVHPDAQLLRIQTLERVLESNGKLNAWSSKICELAYNKLGLTPTN